MPTADAIRWFKGHFNDAMAEAMKGTPFDVDLLTAIACQESGYIWDSLRKKNMLMADILALCVGDTIDAPNRDAFPRNKAELLAAPDGDRMFAIARQALVDMAKHVPGFAAMAAKPNKFCHGFGVFQYDLQFFRDDPGYFLEKRYAVFAESLAKAVKELLAAMRRIHWSGKTVLTEMEMVGVAIAYNTGTYVPSKGLKQGHEDDGRFYGEAIYDFMRLSRSVPAPAGGAALAASPAAVPLLPAVLPVAAEGTDFNTRTLASVLNVRSTPEIPQDKPARNIIATLPEGHPVRAVGGKKNGFLEIETSLHGALIHGYASAKYLAPAGAPQEIPVLQPAAAPSAGGIGPVFMPRKPGTVTRRTEAARAC